MHTWILLCLIGPSFTLATGAQYPYPFWDPTLSWDERLDDLVNRLSLEEIVNQTLSPYAPGVERLGVKPYMWATECLRGQLLANTTAFPQTIGLAASFNRDLIYRMSEAISKELRGHWNGNKAQGKLVDHQGLSCYAPMINIMRHPLWGRNQETYGEDPFLSGSLSQSFVWGLQGDHPRYIRANAGCKSFDAYAGPENIPSSRFSFDVKVSNRDWRMTYLPQFKMCIEAGSYSMMCSYNSINGIPSCVNHKLLTEITREEYGFQGFVVSDAGAISRLMTAHHYLNNSVDATAAAIKAGCNQELGSDHWFLHQIDALKQGKLTEAEIRNNVRPLLYTRLRLGEFDPEEMVPFNDINISIVQCPKHRELALEVATQTFVLLKNNGNLLPLKKIYKKVAFVGPMAHNVDQMFGDYSSDIVRKFTTTVYEGLSKLGQNATLSSGCDNTHCDKYNSSLVIDAVKGSDLVVVALGTGQAVETEGHDRSSLALPGHQEELLKDAVEVADGSPVILLLFNAGPLNVTWAKYSSDVTAIMACFFPAQSTGQALYHSLTMADAHLAPAGRLPATWPYDPTQIPAMTNYSMAGHTYRYYERDGSLYPFGYGLSYTSFKYTYLALSSKSIKAGDNLKVRVQLTNTGPYSSYEVVQVYMSWPSDTKGIPVPKIQLVGFARPFIDPGEVTEVSFDIKSEQMMVWLDDTTGFGYIPGHMTIYAGGQQPHVQTTVGSNILQETFILGSKFKKLKTMTFSDNQVSKLGANL